MVQQNYNSECRIFSDIEWSRNLFPLFPSSGEYWKCHSVKWGSGWRRKWKVPKKREIKTIPREFYAFCNVQPFRLQQFIKLLNAYKSKQKKKKPLKTKNLGQFWAPWETKMSTDGVKVIIVCYVTYLWISDRGIIIQIFSIEWKIYYIIMVLYNCR